MKYAHNIWISSALLLVVAACNREPVNPEDTLGPGENMSIELTMDTQTVVTKSTFDPAGNGVMEAGVVTKTSYSGEVTGGYERIDWTVNDVIRLFTDNESADGNQSWSGNGGVGKMTDYKVTGVSPSGNRSFATITPDGSQKALKWGSGAHEVFGFYPSPASSGASASFSGHAGPLNFSNMVLNGAVEFSAAKKSNTWNFTAAPPMSQAYLWAAASLASPVGKLEMPFRPLFNAVQVQFTRQDILETATLPAGKAAADFRLNAVTLTSVGKDVKASYGVAITKGSSWQQATSATNIQSGNGKTVRYEFPAYGAASGSLTASQNAAGNHVYATTGYTVRFFLPFNSYGASDGLKITFEFKHTDNATTFTRTLLLKRSGSEWLTMDPGDKIVLSPGEAAVWEYVLEVTNDVNLFDAGDGSTKDSKYRVVSYRRNKNNPSQTEPVKWATYVNVGGRESGAYDWKHIGSYTPQNSQLKAGWIRFQNTANGAGGLVQEQRTVYADNYSTTIQSSDPEAFFKDAIALNLHPSGINNLTDSENAIDLSMYDIRGEGPGTVRNTANCYVISAPGWYKIPLVYGNMIKNGANNTSAADSYHVDHRGQSITRPWIRVQLGEPTLTPELVWQDNNPVCSQCGHDHGVIDIQEAFVSDDKNYLYFRVPQHSIQPGNNVIGVKANGELAWSWHIWVTDQPLGTKDDRYLNAMIGWIPLSLQGGSSLSTVYPARSEQIKVVQVLDDGTKDPAGLEKEVLFYQPGNVSHILFYNREYKFGRGVYFQYGRKDPMFPALSTGGNNITQPVYNGSGTLLSGASNAQMPKIDGNTGSISHSIQNPTVFYASNSTPFQGAMPGYWSPAKKTVYDPSPIGYRVIDNFSDAFKSEYRYSAEYYKYMAIYDSRTYPGGYVGFGGQWFLPAIGQRTGQDSGLVGTPAYKNDFGQGANSAFATLWSAAGTALKVNIGLVSYNYIGQVGSQLDADPWSIAGIAADANPVICIVE